MALQNIGQLIWPTQQLPGNAIAAAIGATSITFDSATDRLAWVGRAPVTDTLTVIYLRTGAVTTGCDIDVRVESVTNGRPSGSLLAANTNIVVTVADTDDNVWKTATLTSGASLTKGTTEFAIVVTVSSGTPNMVFTGFPGGALSNPAQAHYPLTLQDTGGGTWASNLNAFNWIVQCSTAGVIPLIGLCPTNGSGTITAYNNSTSPDERALKFAPPFTCRAAGIRASIFNVAAGGDFTLSLWDTSGTTDAGVLAQSSIDGDFALSTTQDGYVDLLFNTPVTLTAGATYYLGVRADTANNIGLAEYSNSTVTNAMRAMHGTDSSMMLSTRSWTAGTAGAWSDTSTAIPLIYLIIDQLDDGAGGAGISARLIGGSLV